LKESNWRASSLMTESTDIESMFYNQNKKI
jgi:hypothetical protein